MNSSRQTIYDKDRRVQAIRKNDMTMEGPMGKVMMIISEKIQPGDEWSIKLKPIEEDDGCPND